ncbi:HEPN domain-containing protein [Erythrobacter sp.]|jgi:hypothetical protein|uniref:HEPN domain-containing protein n=1 Tax=Erythrobacter sp. TaxID=1042 RepID=UPI002EBF97DA|nr:HEPN domain-containing protein [Erythrobacter sp.]
MTLRNGFSQPVDLSVKTKEGQIRKFSAILQQDPNYLEFNTIELLGNSRDSREMRELLGSGTVEWWIGHSDPRDKNVRFGEGFVRSAHNWIHLGSDAQAIRPLGIIEILFSTAEHQSKEQSSRISSEVWLTQRPAGWYVEPDDLVQFKALDTIGAWFDVPDKKLKFRLKTISQKRIDERISDEVHLLEIPAVEFEDTSGIAEVFEDQISYCRNVSRLLLSFYYRRPLLVLMESSRNEKAVKTKWQSLKIEPRENSRSFPRSLIGDKEGFIRTGLQSLEGFGKSLRVLFAAVYGYYSSYHANTIETKHAICVRGIEALVSAHEKQKGLDRQVLPNNSWKKVVKKLKEQIDQFDFRDDELMKIKRHISFVPTMSLEERIRRMVDSQGSYWMAHHRNLLDFLPEIILMRNKIVHGERNLDAHNIDRATQKARLIFEMLFLAAAGTKSVSSIELMRQRSYQ